MVLIARVSSWCVERNCRSVAPVAQRMRPAVGCRQRTLDKPVTEDTAMRRARRCVLVLALTAMWLTAVPVAAQQAAAPATSPPAVATTAQAAPALAPAAPAPAPPKIDSGDTAWMLTSAALVLMMTAPGLALFYGGMVRRHNVLGTIMQSFILMAVISIQWVLWGYSVAFGPDFHGITGNLAWMG